MREKEPIAVFLAILVAVGALVLFSFVIVRERLISLQNELGATSSAPVHTTGWQTYQNPQYHFSLMYPPGWQLSTDGLRNNTPFVALGNPLTGTKTYVLQIFIEQNANDLDSGDYAHAVLASTNAQSAQNAAGGSGPQATLQFQKSFLLNVGTYPAYEFSGVFEFDHDAEQIYVAQGSIALHFDFPMAEENPNLSLPVANNNIAHEIVDTLSFSN
jgi:hypothetical protein